MYELVENGICDFVSLSIIILSQFYMFVRVFGTIIMTFWYDNRFIIHKWPPLLITQWSFEVLKDFKLFMLPDISLPNNKCIIQVFNLSKKHYICNQCPSSL